MLRLHPQSPATRKREQLSGICSSWSSAYSYHASTIHGASPACTLSTVRSDRAMHLLPACTPRNYLGMHWSAWWSCLSC